MRDPIVHVQLRYYACEEIQEHVECLRFVEDLALIQLLNVEVLVNRDLNYNGWKVSLIYSRTYLHSA